MKLTNVSCTQFAGIRDKSIAFDDGLNVVYGKNESGKSTIVNLISRTLFQAVRLDGRRDKEFLDSYFPAARKGTRTRGDFADGKLTFEANNESYTLSKEWGADPRCALSTRDVTVRDTYTVDSMLRQALVYGEGVYSELLFSSQKNTNISLHSLLDASQKSNAKDELAASVTRALAESDGITAAEIEEAITKKLDAICGKHWDVERGAPVRKAGRWGSGLGEILKAYYEMEDAREILATIKKLESELDMVSSSYADADSVIKAAEDKLSDFSAFANRLALQSERKKAIMRLENDLQKYITALSQWPVLDANIKKAQELDAEKKNRDLLDKYAAANRIKKEIDAVDMSVLMLPVPSGEEIQKAKTAIKNISALENSLCGMNLNAILKTYTQADVEIRSLRTGELIDISKASFRITEAVTVTVLGIMELTLSPANVDVAATEARIAECKAMVNAIFSKYAVAAAEELEARANKVMTARGTLESLSAKLKVCLDTVSYAELEKAVASIPGTVRSAELINADIMRFCKGNASLFIAEKKASVNLYISEYTSLDDLRAIAANTENEIRNAKAELNAIDDIPAEYRSISNPEHFLASLQNDLKSKQSMRELMLMKKTEAVSRLNTYKESIQFDPAAHAEQTEQRFNEQKELLEHWLHIKKVFESLKEDVASNPLNDLADGFVRNLAVISNSRITSEFPSADRIDINLYSNNSLLDYNKLSEGTKDTVSLAFRLAVLDYLFPEGGGVIVLDDPFTDMDKERIAQSINLVKDASERHQVIFLTCKEEYLDMLDANKIII